MSLESYLLAAPKAELHVHLEGSIQPATLLTLARRNGVRLPADTVEELDSWFRFSDFGHFIEVYLAITGCLKAAEDYELITYELGAELSRQNVRYAEATFSPGTHRGLGVPHSVYFAGLTQGRQRVQRDFGVEINWVFDVVRSSDDADYVVGVAIDSMLDGVVALGLGGPEAGYPPEPFAPSFEKARAAGLHSAPHAGETAGPESIWGALRCLGAQRIGHGVRAIEDPALVEYLVDKRIPLEVCPVSNLRLGLYPNLSEHPLRCLHDAGVEVTVNSDDPPLFNTTVSEQVLALNRDFGFDIAAIDEILLNGVGHSFLPEDRKKALEVQFLQEMALLGRDHLAARGGAM